MSDEADTRGVERRAKEVSTEAQLLLRMITCPYYLGTGTCVSGCRDEPSCQTCGPWTDEIVAVLHAAAALDREGEDG